MTEIVAGESLSVLGVVLFLSQTKQPSGQRTGGWQSKQVYTLRRRSSIQRKSPKIGQDRQEPTLNTEKRATREKEDDTPSQKTTH